MSISSENNSIEGGDFFMRTSEFVTNQVFGSREDLMDWVQNLAYSLGVVVVTKRSNKYPNGFVYKVVLMCDRGGKYKVKDSSKVSGTKKTDCPFELEGKYSNEYNSWTLTVICDEHNHQPVQYMEGHPYAKRLSEDEFRLVADLTKMNVAPRDILSILKKRNLNNVSTIGTIYNARIKIRMAEQVGKSPMQVLMSLLHSNGYIYEFTTTGLNELENLFFVHPTSFDIWRAFPHVLIIDATYKTNMYKMPFVEIVGVTSTSKTFSIAFAFIPNEQGVNYTWVLNCLKLTLDKCMLPRVIVTDREKALINACEEVFPDATQLLCRWHIERNIIRNCRQSFRFVGCIDRIVQSQHTAIKESLENSRIVRIHQHNLRCFKLLRGFVSNEAPKLMIEDHEQWKNRRGKCGCRLRSCCGSPCACELSMYISSRQYISLDSIDIFWRKLDISPSVENDDVNCEDVLENFKENFNKQSNDGKISLLRKLMGIFVPSKTDIREPRVQKNTRGRPSLKKSQQKRRVDPVRQDSCRYSCSTMPNFVGLDSIKEPARHSSYETDLNKKPMIDLNEVPDEFESSYMIDLNEVPEMKGSDILDRIPKVFHPYITSIYDVKPDGNCGYRALAVCLGLDENEYFEYIRQQMREELQNRYDIYGKIFARDVGSMYQDLCFFGSPCPEEHWMKMPEAGVLIANRFGVIVHSLSMLGSSTIFPFWIGPEEVQHHRALTIALINNHFVMVELQGEYPMPVITPYWTFRNISPSAARWEIMYQSRLELFTQLCRRKSGFVDVSD